MSFTVEDFRYLPFRLMEYNRAALEREENPAALVVLAAQERERLRRSGERFNAKWVRTDVRTHSFKGE